MSLFRHISELRRSGSLKTNSKKQNEPTEHQVIFSSITHIHSHGLPTITLSKREQQAVEAIYNKIKLKHNIFPVTKLRQLFAECGLGTLQWITVASSIMESSVGWTGIITDIARQMEQCLGKLASARDEQNHNPVDKQIGAILENASHFGVPVLRHVHELLHSPDVDEDQLDGERPPPVDEETMQRALVVLVCESVGTTFYATAQLLEEQRQEKLRKLRREQEEEERKRQELMTLRSAMASKYNNATSGKTFRKKVAMPITAASSFRPFTQQQQQQAGTTSSTKSPSQERANDDEFPNQLVSSEPSSTPQLKSPATSTFLNTSQQQLLPSTHESNNNNNMESNFETGNKPSSLFLNTSNTEDQQQQQHHQHQSHRQQSQERQQWERQEEVFDEEITPASLLENPDNTRVPLEDVLLALSRLKHVATACECIITTIPVVLLDQIYKLAKNTDSTHPSLQQCTSLITNQVASIYSRALYYFEQNTKQDPSGANASASYIEFSEQLGLLSAIMDLGTDPRGMPVMNLLNNNNDINHGHDDSTAFLENSSSTFALSRETSAANFGAEPSSPGFFRVGSAVIQPAKNFKESHFFSGGFHQPHMVNHNREQMDQLKTIMSDGSYSSFANAHGYTLKRGNSMSNANNGTMMSASSSADFGAHQQEFSLVAGFGDRTATTGFGGEFSPASLSRTPAPRQTFESPLRRETINSLAQNFGLQMMQAPKSEMFALAMSSSNIGTSNSNSNSATKPANINDFITLDSIAKEFFSHSQISTHQKDMNFASVIAMLNLPSATMTPFQSTSQHKLTNATSSSSDLFNSNALGAVPSSSSSFSVQEAMSMLDSRGLGALRKKSIDVVTMLKVTRQFEEVATDGAKQRQLNQQQQGILAAQQQHEREQALLFGTRHHRRRGDDDDDNASGYDDEEENSEERNRTTATELLERTNLVCSPVMLHRGTLVKGNRKSKQSGTDSTQRNDNRRGIAGDDKYGFMRVNDSSFDAHHQEKPRRTSASGGGNSKRGSVVGAEPEEWYLSPLATGNNGRNNGNNKPPETSLSKSSKIVKQISNAPNLSSGAKLYYLRQRMAKLQRGEEEERSDMNAKKRKKTVL